MSLQINTEIEDYWSLRTADLFAGRYRIDATGDVIVHSGYAWQRVIGTWRLIAPMPSCYLTGGTEYLILGLRGQLPHDEPWMAKACLLIHAGADHQGDMQRILEYWKCTDSAIFRRIL